MAQRKKQMIDGSLLFWCKAVAESGKGESVFNAYEWMQYTGLKDKNGKEIYEGDVVRYKQYTEFHENCTERILSVEFDSTHCGFRPMVYQTNVEDGFYDCDVEDIEIIGNVFETPELLEDPIGNNAEPIRNLPEDDRRDDR